MTHHATGIHLDPTLKTGLRPPKNAPALRLSDYLTGQLPEVPAVVDHLHGTQFALDDNDRFGVCGPTGADNLVRLVSKGLTGKPTHVKLADVFDLYRRSGNPDFDPKTGEGDNGVDMQTMLEAFLAGGMGNVKPVAFGRCQMDTDSIRAAIAIFGGVLAGVNLQVSQQEQSRQSSIVWDYKAPHRAWGGHAICCGQDSDAPLEIGAISWKKRVEMLTRFIRYQLSEVWIVIFPWHLDHPAFLQGVDLASLKQDYQALTGGELKVPQKAVKASEELQDKTPAAE